MSLNVPQVPVAAVMDPRLQINQVRDYVALKGSMVNTFQQFPASNVSNASVQITCNPPNRGIAISRVVLQRATFDITITGTNTTIGPLLSPGFYGPRAMPLTMVQNALQVTINNVTLTQSPVQQYWGALMWLGDNDFENRFGQYSLAPSYLDQFQDYADGAGSVRNPLAQYGDNSFENTRGGYAGLELLTNTQYTATLRLTTTEPILLSPFVSGNGSNTTSCLAGVQNMSYQCNFGDFRRVMSLVQDQGSGGGVGITAVTVNLTSFSLLFNYLTPDPLYPVPRSLVSSYFMPVCYPTTFGTPVVAGATVRIPFQSIQVTSIPRRIIIWAREDDANRTAFTSDCFLSLPQDENPLSISWNNNQFMNQASTQDLYNISYKNGCQMSYSQFTRFTGSLIVLDFGTDIGLMSNEAPGTLGNYQLGLTCRFKNTSSRTLNVQMFVLVVYEGTFNVVDGNCSTMIGVLSSQDVLDARPVPGITYKAQKDVYGGAFFDSLKKAFGAAHNFIKQHKIISKGLSLLPDPRAQAASKVASALGYGMSGGSLEDDDKSEEKSEDDYEPPKSRARTPVRKMRGSGLERLLNAKSRSGRVTFASEFADDY